MPVMIEKMIYKWTLAYKIHKIHEQELNQHFIVYNTMYPKISKINLHIPWRNSNSQTTKESRLTTSIAHEVAWPHPSQPRRETKHEDALKIKRGREKARIIQVVNNGPKHRVKMEYGEGHTAMEGLFVFCLFALVVCCFVATDYSLLIFHSFYCLLHFFCVFLLFREASKTLKYINYF